MEHIPRRLGDTWQRELKRTVPSGEIEGNSSVWVVTGVQGNEKAIQKNEKQNTGNRTWYDKRRGENLG